MPLKFWDEAFLTATHLVNMLPTKVINHETPMERLLHKTPDYASLRVFGCACWPNLRPFNQRKLAFRSKQCVFLGYSHMHKGVKCLDIASGRVYISRDVVFDETVFPFASLHSNAGRRLRQEILLLPESLQNSPMLAQEGAQHCTDLTSNVSVIPGVASALQEQQNAGDNSMQNRPETRPNGADLGASQNRTRHEADSPRITETSDSREESASGSGEASAGSFSSAAARHSAGDTSRGPVTEPHRRMHVPDARAGQSPSTASPHAGDH
jgi:hypothetical protein